MNTLISRLSILSILSWLLLLLVAAALCAGWQQWIEVGLAVGDINQAIISFSLIFILFLALQLGRLSACLEQVVASFQYYLSGVLCVFITLYPALAAVFRCGYDHLIFWFFMLAASLLLRYYARQTRHSKTMRADKEAALHTLKARVWDYFALILTGFMLAFLHVEQDAVGTHLAVDIAMGWWVFPSLILMMLGINLGDDRLRFPKTAAVLMYVIMVGGLFYELIFICYHFKMATEQHAVCWLIPHGMSLLYFITARLKVARAIDALASPRSLPQAQQNSDPTMQSRW